MIDGRNQGTLVYKSTPKSGARSGAGLRRHAMAGRRCAALALAAGAAFAIAGCSQIKVADDSSGAGASMSESASSSESASPRAAAPSDSATPPASPPASPVPAPGEPAPAPGQPGAPAPEGAPAPAAPAPVDPQQRDNFLALTDQLGASMPEGVDPEGVITEACGQLGGGAPLQDVLGFVGDKGGYDAEKASFFLAGGVPVFCPDNTSKLTG